MNLKFALLLTLSLLLPSLSFAQEGVTRVSADSVTSDASWSGRVLVERPLAVRKGATLTIKPGTEVRFAKGAGLTVEGVLKAVGRKGSVIVFTSASNPPAAGDWSGINFTESGEGSALRRCGISYAGAVSMAGCSVAVQDCEIQKGVKGVVLARKARPTLEGNAIRDMSEGGVHCQMGSEPVITGNTIERCTSFGIAAEQEAHPDVKNNTISGCGTGMYVSQPVPPVEGNTFKGNKAGLMCSQVSGGLIIRGNRFRENETGIVCQQFSNPLIEKNVVSGNKEGLVCFRASSPMIRNNDISANDSGVLCIQLCNPRITANNIYDNKRGIYLDLSSYALINGNNIYANKLQVELGNMSSDWEQRVNKKPQRGSQAQNLTMASKGRAPLQQDIEDGSQIMGHVDATGNWWGADATGEMDSKGPSANIKSFIDYYDVPTRTYEGYSGIYVQDRIKYEGWKKARIKNAGPQGL